MASGKRGRSSKALPSILRDSLILVQRGKHYQLQIEFLEGGLEGLTEAQWETIARRVAGINAAIRKRQLGVTPGVSAAKLLKPREALEALGPGVVNPKIWGSPRTTRQFLAKVEGQLIPFGIKITLTPAETDELINALDVAAPAAVLGVLLESFGLAAPVAAALAAVLVTLAVQLRLCRALSATGAVGFKIIYLPPLPPTVVVYPA